MPVYKSSTPTKDGKCWFYKIQYTDSLCNIVKYTSKKFMTRAIAKDEERKQSKNFAFWGCADRKSVLL